MFYTSILPPDAKEIKKRKLPSGSVLESIMAIANAKRGERATAGLGIGWVYKDKKKEIGLVAEYSGRDEKTEAHKLLKKSLKEMFNSRYDKRYKMKTKIIIKSFIPKKKYGTALVAICFVSYKFIFK